MRGTDPGMDGRKTKAWKFDKILHIWANTKRAFQFKYIHSGLADYIKPGCFGGSHFGVFRLRFDPLFLGCPASWR